MPITVSHAKSNSIADFAGAVTVGNSSGGTLTVQATDLVRPSDWNSVHNYTVNLSASEVAPLFVFNNGLSRTTAAGGISVGIGEVEYFEPWPVALTATTSHTPGIGTWYFDPFVLPYAIESGVIRMPVTNASELLNAIVISQNSSSQGGMATINGTNYHKVAIYTYGQGADITRIGTVWTGEAQYRATRILSVGSTGASMSVGVQHSATLEIPGQWDINANVVYSTITASGTLSNNATSLASSSVDSLIAGVNVYLSGSRMDVIPFNTTLAAGGYVFAHQFWSTVQSSTSFSATGGVNYASAGTTFATKVMPMLLENNFGVYKQLGKSVSNSTSMFAAWHGIHAVSQSSAWSTVGLSDLRMTNVRAIWNFAEVALT